jgi:hypothetical protein
MLVTSDPFQTHARRWGHHHPSRVAARFDTPAKFEDIRDLEAGTRGSVV